MNKKQIKALYDKHRRNKFISQNLCSACGKVTVIGQRTCFKCQNKSKINRKVRFINNKCAYCKENRMPWGHCCELCWMARNGAHTKNHWRPMTERLLLQEKFNKQNRCCIYTGIKLIPGKNTSMDHIVPLSAGGLDLISNIQFVYLPVNYMKHKLIESEFIKLCKLIASRNK